MEIKGSNKQRNGGEENSEQGDMMSPSSISMLSTSITGGLDLNDEMSKQGDFSTPHSSKFIPEN